MRFLFILRNQLLVRNFGSSINKLLEDGHEVSIVFTREKQQVGENALQQHLSKSEKLKLLEAPESAHKWGGLAGNIRNARNYIRYLHPDLYDCPALRNRAEIRTSVSLVKTSEKIPSALRKFYRKSMNKLLSLLDDSIPPAEQISNFLKENECDLLIASPLVDLDSEEIEYVKAAGHAGIPTCLWTASWDNLTNKGIIQGKPDSVIVWNEIMKKEAVKFHGIKNKNVHLSGAQLFDWWFKQKPSLNREAFCKELGLNPEKKTITYLCSSVAISQNENKSILNWVKTIRLHPDPLVSQANIIIRPYPLIKDHILDDLKKEMADIGNLAIWPTRGEWVISDESKRTYFDTIYWSDAVTGVNTSAFIEAGILNTPCLTIVNEGYKNTQDGTVHFKYLTEGGLLYRASNFKEHGEQLLKALTHPELSKDSTENFIREFIRPAGLEKESRDVVVDILSNSELIKRKKRFRPKLRHKFCKSILKRFTKDNEVKDMTASSKEHMEDHFQAKKNQKQSHAAQKAEYVERHMVRRADLVNEMAEKALSNRKIILGPWLGGIEDEIIHWIPFMKWMQDKFEISPDDCISVSRGGIEEWYKGVSVKHFNIHSMFSESEFYYYRQQHLTESALQTLSTLDREIVSRVKSETGVGEVELFHPSTLNEILTPYNENELDLHYIRKISKFKPLKSESSQILDTLGLKDKNYTAIKFYSNENFIDSNESRDFINKLIDGISPHSTVLILDNNYASFDKKNLTADRIDGAVHLRDHCGWENNLKIQSELIANAEAFYGTYGGFSYLSCLLGTDSYNFYNNPDYKLNAKTQDVHMTLDGNPPLGLFSFFKMQDWAKIQPALETA